MLEAPASSLIGITLLVSLAALLVTAILTPLVMMRFRARVSRIMNTAARPDTDAHDLPVSDRVGECRPAPSQDALAIAQRKRLRLACVFALAGLAHALATSVIFLATMGGSEALATTAFYLPVFAAFALPVVPSVIQVLGWQPRAVLGGTLAMVLAGLLQPAGGLYLAIAQLHLLVPTAAFLLFSLRFWRAVAPLILLVSALAAFGWLTGLAVARAMTSDTGSIVWTARLAGLGCGILLGLALLRQVGTLHATKRMSDQDLFIDGWWAIFSLVQSVTFMVRTEDPLLLASALTFLVYWLVKRAAMPLAVGLVVRSPTPLLLLRVFGHSRRTERLHDGVSRLWRAIGPVYLIAGHDLALKTVTPAQFHAFLRGTLAGAFVSDGCDLERRLRELDDRPDRDGFFRINHVFCHADSWRLALQALLARSATILVDLRGFSAQNQGVVYELREIGRGLAGRSVVLISDATTDRALARAVIEAARPGTSSGAITWLDASVRGPRRLHARAVRLLLDPNA